MSGDLAAQRLEGLINQYGALIRSVAARMLGRRGAGARDDVEQEVIVALWKRLRNPEPIDYPAAYVCQAARREAIRVLKREAARLEQVESAAVDAPAPETEGPGAALAGREARERLNGAIERLGPERQKAVRAHLMGFEVKEIMEMYGWTYNKARNLIARGVADVRALLAQGRLP